MNSFIELESDDILILIELQPFLKSGIFSWDIFGKIFRWSTCIFILAIAETDPHLVLRHIGSLVLHPNTLERTHGMISVFICSIKYNDQRLLRYDCDVALTHSYDIISQRQTHVTARDS